MPQFKTWNPAVERFRYQLPSEGRNTDKSVLPSPSKSALDLIVATPLTVIFAPFISKKILPTASTLILPVVILPTGIVTDSEPSFAVLASNVVGNERPPSVEKEIFTFAALIGAAVVFA